MIPQHYPIETGKLYGSEYPGDPDPGVEKIRLRNLISLNKSMKNAPFLFIKNPESCW